MFPIIQIKDVVKTYGSFYAVNNVSLTIPKGKIFGMLGPNGAGKTSLIRMITSITKPDSGTILFEGEALGDRHQKKVGYMPEERGLYKKMEVEEQLLYLAQLKGMSRADAQKAIKYWFEKLDIGSWKNKKIEELSKGMQQKIQFVVTVIHNPSLIILDEPFSGLDPINATLIQDEIFQLHNQGATVIFSTHRMEQVEQICDEIVLINKGRNVLQGEVKEVKNRFKEHLFEVEYQGELKPILSEKFDLQATNENTVKIKLRENQLSKDMLKAFVEADTDIVSFREILPTLNEVFIKQVTSEIENGKWRIDN